jgi:hypothetical protein
MEKYKCEKRYDGKGWNGNPISLESIDCRFSDDLDGLNCYTKDEKIIVRDDNIGYLESILTMENNMIIDCVISYNDETDEWICIAEEI